jgi:hypothetical protein
MDDGRTFWLTLLDFKHWAVNLSRGVRASVGPRSGSSSGGLPYSKRSHPAKGGFVRGSLAEIIEKKEWFLVMNFMGRGNKCPLVFPLRRALSLFLETLANSSCKSAFFLYFFWHYLFFIIIINNSIWIHGEEFKEGNTLQLHLSSAFEVSPLYIIWFWTIINLLRTFYWNTFYIELFSLLNIYWILNPDIYIRPIFIRFSIVDSWGKKGENRFRPSSPASKAQRLCVHYFNRKQRLAFPILTHSTCPFGIS